MRLLRPASATAAAMDSLRKWLYKPKRDDHSLLAQFFYADEALNMVAAELDSFDGRDDPERCSTLVNQLRHAQERVLNITGQIMDQLLGNERTPRGFRVKFPEDILQDNLPGQLWFGAECLAAGSSIMHREEESAAMRPLARALTRSLETVRTLLRDHCLRCNRSTAPPPPACTEMLHESLKIFDRLFAEFELCYVSAMVPVKSPREFEVQQLISVLFSETLQRARRIGLLTQDQVDDYDPALMFAIPRLAIVSGLLIFSNGPLSIDKPPELMSDMFRPFRNLLHKIRELLWTLDRRELYLLEKLLCTNEDIANIQANVDIFNEKSAMLNVDGACYPAISEFVTQFYSDYSHCKDMLNEIRYDWENTYQDNPPSSSTLDRNCDRNALITDADYLPETMEIFSPILDGMRRLSHIALMEDIPETVQSSENNSNLASTVDSKTEATAEIDGPNSTDSCNEDKNTFPPQKNDHIRLNVEYCETESNDNNYTKDSDNEDSQERMNLIISINERRNSNRSIGSRKSSRNESVSSPHSNELLIRSLSSNGLSMFDPLSGSSVMNINPMPTDMLLPDQNLVSNLSDQVSEIADKLSSISYRENSENIQDSKNHMDSNISNLLHDQVSGQIYSFSTNDVSNLSSNVNDPEFNNITSNVTYSPSRNDKIMSQTSNVPSTSHGYLISNAISQEPAIMASLANNNNMMYDESTLHMPFIETPASFNLRMIENEVFCNSASNPNSNTDLISQPNPDVDSLLIVSEDQNISLSQNYAGNNNPFVSDQHPPRPQPDANRAQFFIGYESDSNDQTPGDSGICTENTSLDRSPDSEMKDIKGNCDKSLCNPSETEISSTIANNTASLNRTHPYASRANDVTASETKYESRAVSSEAIGSLHIEYTERTDDCQNNDAGSSQIVTHQDLSTVYENNSAKTSDISVSNNSIISDYPNRMETRCVSCDSHMCSCNSIKCNTVSDVNENNTTDIPNLQNSYDNVNVKDNNCDNKLSVDSVSRNNVSGNTRVNSNNNVDSNSNEISNNQPLVDDSHIFVNEESTSTSAQSNDQSTSTSNSTAVLNQRKLKKSSPKHKKKSSKSRHSSVEAKMWSPGRVVLQNRHHSEQKSPIKLNLEQLVDDGAGGSCSSQSSATSSFHSDWADDEEIALAIQAQEIASRHQIRAKFKSSEDLIHRLFVCIAGVADQLQTNFASDLRNILKSVFLMNQTPDAEPEPVEVVEEAKSSESTAIQQTEQTQASTASENQKSETIEYEVSGSDVLTNGDSFDSIHSAEEVYADNSSPLSQRSNPNLRLSQTNLDENAQNDFNERRHSQPSKQSSNQSNSDSRSSSRRNTISTVMARSKQISSEQDSDPNTDDRTSLDNTEDLTEISITCNSSNHLTDVQNTDDFRTNNVHSRNIDNLAESIERQSYAIRDYPNTFIANGSHYRSNQGIRENVINDNACIRDRTLRPSNITVVERAPEWVPDIAAPDCMRCGVHFTAFRRRHHCRNCGKVFCASCSANSIPLPRFGQPKPVRVCEECYQMLAKPTCASRQITNTNGGRQANYTHR